MSQKKPWFEEWFDSPYYHILYGHRNNDEASAFVRKLIAEIKPKPKSAFLDLACGKGRHALEINKMGYPTTGIDLSKDSISYAKQFESDTLSFFEGDMRQVHFPASFDYVFNLFTSFGYFDDNQDNLKVLNAVVNQLKPGGTFVIDYINYDSIKNQFPYTGVIVRNGIQFNIQKRIVQGASRRIEKDIFFEDQGTDFKFTERVQIFELEELLAMLKETGLQPQTFWGDYRLNPYRQGQSDRMIILCKKEG